MAADITQLCKRYDALFDAQANWRAGWEELANFILPRKSGITTKNTPGRKQTAEVYDSTAIMANTLLAASMQGNLTSLALRWFSLKTRDEELNKVKSVAVWLEDCASRMYSAFQNSNLNQELQEVYIDLGAFGIGCLYSDYDDEHGLVFEAIQLGEYAIGENAFHRVDVLFRSFDISARAAIERWGNKVGDKIQKVNEKNPEEMVSISQGIYPRTKPYGRTRGKKKYASCYFSKDHKHLIDEGGHDEFPYMVPRWTKRSGEIYGRGPGHTAIPDVRSLNKAKELTLKNAAKKLDPPVESRHNGVIGGTVRMGPSSVNVVREMGNIKVLDLGGDIQTQQIVPADLRSSIREAYYWDQLQLQQNQPMTATEVERRWETMQRVLGPTLGRLENEALAPLIARNFGLMARRGLFLPRPPELVEADQATNGGVDIDVIYEGPLARAQRSSNVAAIERTWVTVAPMAEADPSVLLEFDLGQAAREIANANGVPQSMLRDPAQVEEMKAAQTAAAEQETQKADMLAMAEGAGKVAPFMKASQEAPVA